MEDKPSEVGAAVGGPTLAWQSSSTDGSTATGTGLSPQSGDRAMDTTYVDRLRAVIANATTLTAKEELLGLLR